MKIVFIGAGNVATHLATELYKYDYNIVQVYSRTNQSAEALASLVQADAVTDTSRICTDADIYIFSVKDSVLEELAAQLRPNNGLWLHTAGSMPLSIFDKYTSRYGVLYPFQTFTKGRSIEWQNIPIFIESGNNTYLNILQDLASKLSEKVFPISSEQRKYLHLAGVFACNFTNHMYALSSDILKKADLPFDVALPLIDETCSKIHDLSPIDAQTGPAVRYDENVINRHLSMLENDRLKDIYKTISESIHRSSRTNQQ